MKHLNKLRRWEHDVCFHLFHCLDEVIAYWKNIKIYYIIYIEDEGREKPKIILQKIFSKGACAEIKRGKSKSCRSKLCLKRSGLRKTFRIT